MLPDVLLAPLDSVQLFSLDLARLLDALRHMALALDPSDLRHVRIPLDKRLIIFQLRSLTGTLDSAAIGCVRTPESDITIIRPR